MHPAALKRLIAEIISQEKSYRVPSICSAIGLATGTDGEAFSGKFRYVERRLDAIGSEKLLDLVANLKTLVQSSKLDAIFNSTIRCTPADSIISSSIENHGSGAVAKRWTDALERRQNDPEGAITLARTLLEDVCKDIIVSAGRAFEETDDIPKLYRKTAEILTLAPDQHTEAIFKKILASCGTIVDSLGTLRNRLGDAHSIGPIRAKPSARHALLAVNLSGAMATFLVETYAERNRSTTP